MTLLQNNSDVFSQKEHCSLNENRYLFVEIRRLINLNWKTLNLDSRVHKNGKLFFYSNRSPRQRMPENRKSVYLDFFTAGMLVA